MARKPKDEAPEDEEVEDGLRDEEDELDEAGFHVADGDDEAGPAPDKDEEKGLDSEEDVEYVRGPKKARRRPGTKLLDDYEDHLAEEEDEEEEREEDDLEDEEDWDEEGESDDEEDEEDD